MASSLVLALALCGAAQASIPDLIGMGPANMGSGSASTALADDAYAPYYNPAGLAQLKRITIGAGPVFGQANLRAFKGVVYDANGDGLTQDLQGYPDYGAVGTDYRLTDSEGVKAPLYTNGIQFGLVIPFWRYFAFGIAGYLPHGDLLHISAADPYMPYYVLFANRNNRFSLSPAISINPIQGLYLGAGFQLMADIYANVKAGVNANVSAFPSNGGDTSVSGAVSGGVTQLDADILPVVGLNGGLLLDGSMFARPDDAERISKLKRHGFGVSYRSPWVARVDADVTATANGLIRFDDQTVMLSSLLSKPIEISLSDLESFYTPANLAIGIRTGFGDLRDGEGVLEDRARLTLTADVDFTKWSGFKEMVTPALDTEVNTIEGVKFTAHVGDDYGATNFHDTKSAHIGGRYTIDLSKGNRALGPLRLNLRAGGGYVQSPVPNQTGRTNYMDSDRIIASAGLGIETGHLIPVESWAPVAKGPVQFDIGGEYQSLRTRTVTKDADLVADNDGDGILDYPRGYPLGGQITSAGSYWAVMVGFQMQIADPQRPPKAVRRSKADAPTAGGAR